MSTAFSREQIIAAHQHCTNNRAELMRSEICACTYCFTTFSSSAIADWVEEMTVDNALPPDQWTALCPNCPVDAVMGSASGYPVTDQRFLEAMHKHWF